MFFLVCERYRLDVFNGTNIKRMIVVLRTKVPKWSFKAKGEAVQLCYSKSQIAATQGTIVFLIATKNYSSRL